MVALSGHRVRTGQRPAAGQYATKRGEMNSGQDIRASVGQANRCQGPDEATPIKKIENNPMQSSNKVSYYLEIEAMRAGARQARYSGSTRFARRQE
jgi:hypothetical protein